MTQIWTDFNLMWLIIYMTLSTCTLSAQTITNLTVAPRTDGSGLVDVYYTLSGTATTYYIIMEASFNNGSTYSAVSSNYLTGHIGAVAPGSNRHIIWNGKGSNNNTYSTQTKVKLILATSAPCGQPFTDARDGKTYTTVQIGTQCWIAQNLNIGTKINASGNQTNNNIIEKYCISNTESGCNSWGGLYQWNEMMQYMTTAGVQGICPAGWHLPTDGEWCTMTQFIDQTVNCNALGWSGTDAGLKLKNTSGWLNNGNGTNSSGFTALPGGHRAPDGIIYDLGLGGYFWSSSSEYLSNLAWHRQLYYTHVDVQRSYNFNGKMYGFSVRCLRDT